MPPLLSVINVIEREISIKCFFVFQSALELITEIYLFFRCLQPNKIRKILYKDLNIKFKFIFIERIGSFL